MRARISILAISLAVGAAMAQEAAPQTDKTNKNDKQANQPAATTTTNNKVADTNKTPAEMKTMTFKGVLVDMSCGSAPAGTTTAATTPAPAGSESANTANRAANDSTATCPLKADSSQLGMKLNDG